MRNKLITLAVVIAMFGLGTPVLAQKTILPEAGADVAAVNCASEIDNFNKTGKLQPLGMSNEQVLGCAIKTGRVSLGMIPYFIQYFSNYALGLVSILALLFIVIGGMLYTVGGLSEKKEQGKSFITNALGGMAIAFLAWTIVNVIISAVTG